MVSETLRRRRGKATSTAAAPLKGCVLGVILHDVCEEIRFEELRGILGARRTEPSFKHATEAQNAAVSRELIPSLAQSATSVSVRHFVRQKLKWIVEVIQSGYFQPLLAQPF